MGSCGPRGFYGTFDVHLEVERVLAEYLGAEECILYSDAIASISSVIPAFAKKGDVIVADDSCSFAVQQGCQSSTRTAAARQLAASAPVAFSSRRCLFSYSAALLTPLSLFLSPFDISTRATN